MQIGVQKIVTERSDLSAAKIANVSDKTVATVRRGLERRSEIPNIATRTDTAGRQQPAAKPPKPPSKEAQSESDAPDMIEAPGDRKDALRIIDDTVRLLQQRQAEVKGIAIGIRVARVRSLMDALGVEDSHLIPPGRR